jgi:hypothetical protein
LAQPALGSKVPAARAVCEQPLDKFAVRPKNENLHKSCGAFGSPLAVLLTAAFLVFPIGRLRATAQETEAKKSKSVADQIARGKYIVARSRGVQ